MNFSPVQREPDGSPRVIGAGVDYLGLALELSKRTRPPQPDWFKKLHDETLQEIWDQTLSDKLRVDTRTG